MIKEHEFNIKNKNYWIERCNIKYNIQYGRKRFNFNQRKCSARVLENWYFTVDTAEQLQTHYDMLNKY
jgi:hypothetical protein